MTRAIAGYLRGLLTIALVVGMLLSANSRSVTHDFTELAKIVAEHHAGDLPTDVGQVEDTVGREQIQGRPLGSGVGVVDALGEAPAIGRLAELVVVDLAKRHFAFGRDTLQQVREVLGDRYQPGDRTVHHHEHDGFTLIKCSVYR